MHKLQSSFWTNPYKTKCDVLYLKNWITNHLPIKNRRLHSPDPDLGSGIPEI